LPTLKFPGYFSYLNPIFFKVSTRAGEHPDFLIFAFA